jgi:hypothetical protein
MCPIVKLNITAFDNLVQHTDDYIITTILQKNKTMALWMRPKTKPTHHDHHDHHYHHFMFLDLLFCDEVHVIYLTDYYGYTKYNNGAMSTLHRIQYRQFQDVRIYALCMNAVKNALQIMHPTYSVRHYNKGDLTREKQNCIVHLQNQLQVLSLVFPEDVVRIIGDYLVPNWLYYTRNHHIKRYWKYYYKLTLLPASYTEKCFYTDVPELHALHANANAKKIPVCFSSCQVTMHVNCM